MAKRWWSATTGVHLSTHTRMWHTHLIIYWIYLAVQFCKQYSKTINFILFQFEIERNRVKFKILLEKNCVMMCVPACHRSVPKFDWPKMFCLYTEIDPTNLIWSAWPHLILLINHFLLNFNIFNTLDNIYIMTPNRWNFNIHILSFLFFSFVISRPFQIVW